MIAIANDHSALDMKAEILSLLDQMGLPYQDFGTDSANSCDYPIFAARAARAVASGACERGIVLCGTGIGVSITANKIPGIRCALCHEAYSARLTREHNDANMLAIGARVTGPELAKDIVRTFLTTPFSGEARHVHRVGLLTRVEQGEDLE